MKSSGLVRRPCAAWAGAEGRACGEGFYTRRIKQAGAAEVTGVDISAAMIQLTEEEEQRHQ